MNLWQPISRMEKGGRDAETYTGQSASGRIGEVGKSDQRKSLPKPGAHFSVHG